jgi:putative transposase
MTSIDNSFVSVKRFIEELRQGIGQRVADRLEKRLEAEVDVWLQRSFHERREQVGRHQTSAHCCRCGSRQARHFSRNGHRRRQLVTSFGVLTFWLPRVVCECGGSVEIPFSVVVPYQRLWDDVVEQIGRWAELGLSLRQMQGEIGHQGHTQIGLRSLNRVVQQVRQPLDRTLSSVPPVILLDAIWITLLEPTAAIHLDRRGRRRIRKKGEKVCVLVALGLYPQSGRWGILGWELADGESQAAWERLLVRLEARGIYRERGLELLIHDGGSGLIAALHFIYPHIPHQRCLFHKFRNLWQAIQPPPQASRTEARTFKQDLIGQVKAIFFADSAAEAQRLCDDFCQRLHPSQPELVATLCRDWQDSIAFYRVLAHFPDWSRHFLRTTSLLERVNRMIRRLFRAACAFHSASGLLAAVARVLFPFWLT